MYLQKFIFLFLFTFFLSFSSEVFASTIIDADITENTTWTENQSPYIVSFPIIIAENVTLTIDPGVIVKFDYGGSFLVYGILNSLGTAAQPIYFTSYADDSIGGDTNNDGEDSFPFEGDWDSILIQSPNAQSIFNHTVLRYSDGELILLYGSSIVSDTFDSDQGIMAFDSNSSFTNLTISDLYAIGGSDFSIDGAVISNPDSSSVYVYGESSLILKNATLRGSDTVLYVFDDSSATLDSVDIMGNIFSDGAVYLFRNSHLDMNKSSIMDVYNGLNVFYDSAVKITDSSISCENGGIAIYENSTLNLSGGSVSCGSDGMLFYNEIKATINDVKITGANDAGIIAYNNFNPDPITITESEITGNKYGFVVFNTGISAHQNNIHNNITNGVLAFSPLDPNVFDFTNNYWGDASGPKHLSNQEGLGDVVSDDVLFTPWLTSDPLVECCSSVLFLPGIKASRLYSTRADESEDQLWEPNSNSDVEDLYLNVDGTSKNPDIYTKDIIKETSFGKLNIYKSFAKMMDILFDDHKISEWKEFAYDWRQGVDNIVNNGTEYQDGNVSLIETLQSLVSSSKNGKVAIIAHSNGGLLAKALLKKLQDDKNAGINNLIDSVDVLILVAVPEIGTALSVPAILHGYDQDILGGLLTDKIRARELGRNMKSAFGLLPSKEYINHVSASPVTFVDTVISSNVTTKMVETFGNVIDSYSEYKSFLFGAEGRVNPNSTQTDLPINLSESLFTQAENLHNNIDAWVPPESLRVIEVAGWGLPTVGSFEYYPKACTESLECGFILDERPRFTSDGDGTVVVPSAHYMNFLGNAEKYWVDFKNYNTLFRVNREHKDILEINSLNDFIKSIIEENNIILDETIKEIEPIDTSNRLRLSIHSPVTLDAYDIDSNHTGKICPPASDFCYLEEDIPNSSYLEFGEGKYINLPEDEFFKIKLQGTNIGTFTYESEEVLPDGTSTISSFVDIPVTTQTQAEITLNSNTQIPQLALDVTGDGKSDFTLTPNATFDPIIYLQIMKATIDSLDLPQARIKAFDKRVDNIIKSIQKGKIDRAKLKADRFKSVLEKKLSKPDPKHPKLKKLSKTDAQLLLDMLNKLLDNIS